MKVKRNEKQQKYQTLCFIHRRIIMTKPKTRSRGELKIADILRSNNIPFAEEYIFPDLVSSCGRPLRFDFAVFDDE